MPRDNSGAFQRLRRWTDDAANAVDLLPERIDEDMDDIAAALSDTPSRTEMNAAFDAVNAALAGYESETEFAAAMALKADKTYVDNQFGLKTDVNALLTTVSGHTTQIAGKVSTSSVGVANGVAGLDSGGKVPISQIPELTIEGDVHTLHDTWDHATVMSAYHLANDRASRIDQGVNVVVETISNAVPGSPADGKWYLVGSSPSGTFAGHANALAKYTAAGTSYSYRTPTDGMTVLARDTDVAYYWDSAGSAWVAYGGGATVGTTGLVASSLDSRVVGFAKTNGHGGARYRAHWTADSRIVIYGDQSALAFDPAGDSWGPYEIPVPWDTSALTISNIYAGINYLLILLSDGSLWHFGSSAHGQGGNGSTTATTIPTKITKFTTDGVSIAKVWTEAGLGNVDAFWFALTTAGTVYACGRGTNYTMGNGATGDLSTPRKLTLSDGTTVVTNVVEVSCATVYAPVWLRCADGKALRFGAGTDGAHGNGNTTAIQWPTYLETAVGSGVSRTDIAQIRVTGSSCAAARAVTWLLTSAGKIEVSGNRTYGNGDGSALLGAAVTTFQAASGTIASLTVTAIYAGGGEVYNCVAITSTGTGYLCGYCATYAQLGDGATTNLNVFTAFSGLPSGFSGALTGAAVAGGGIVSSSTGLVTIYLEATISGVKQLASIGYDAHYETGKGTTGVSAGSQTWGLVLNQRLPILAWQTVGEGSHFGIETLDSNGELRYAGANDQGQAGVQFGNLHSVPIMQPCRPIGPRLLKNDTPRGSYSAGTQYSYRDVVRDQGSTWRYINPTPGTGNAPPTLPTTGNAYWECVAQKGDAGSTGATGPAGSTGATGPSGATGAAGPVAIDYTWDTGTTAADPGSGKIRASVATFTGSFNLYISETDRLGNGLAAFLQSWDDSTNPTTKGVLEIIDLATPTNRAFLSITGSVTDNGTYDTVPVTFKSGATSFSAVNVGLLFTPAGDRGAAGADGAAVAPFVGGLVVYKDDGSNIASGGYIVERYVPRAATLDKLYVEVTNGTGTFDVNVKKNGSTIATATGTTTGAATTISNTLAIGDNVTFDITSITGTVTGAFVQLSGLH